MDYYRVAASFENTKVSPDGDTNMETHDHTHDHYDTRTACPAHGPACLYRSSQGEAGTHWAVHPSGGAASLGFSQQRQDIGHSPENHIEPKPEY